MSNCESSPTLQPIAVSRTESMFPVGILCFLLNTDVNMYYRQVIKVSPQQMRNDAILPPTLSSDRTVSVVTRLTRSLQMLVIDGDYPMALAVKMNRDLTLPLCRPHSISITDTYQRPSSSSTTGFRFGCGNTACSVYGFASHTPSSNSYPIPGSVGGTM